MMSNPEDVLLFLRDFETSSREYLKAKGIYDNDVANAQLELQWKFLHTILKQYPVRSGRHESRRNLTPRTQRATIA
ncbi:MAG: hypothetical protein ACYCVD_09650 [Desulfitobacteriaceae bacterium]